jgi:GNAT superfamily N-acetyltransferase
MPDISNDRGEPAVQLTDTPDPQLRDVLEHGLATYGTERLGYRDWQALAISVGDPQTGETVGGLSGWTSYGLFFLDLFYLPSAMRRRDLGSRILRQAEAEARRRGCRSVVLFTTTFQAPGFYRKQGYHEFGRIPCEPAGHARVFFRKSLAVERGAATTEETEQETLVFAAGED